MAFSASVFKTRFPTFNTVSDDLLLLMADEAALIVTTRWPADARDIAIMYLVAHMLTAEPSSTVTTGTGGGATAGPLIEYRVGDVVHRFANNSSSADFSSSDDSLSATPYGRYYKRLRDKYFRGPMVV